MNDSQEGIQHLKSHVKKDRLTTTIKEKEEISMYSMFEQMDRMWRNLDAMFNYPLTVDGSKFKTRGLKNVINRPHNLITKKDDSGVVKSFQLEVPYTPFKKDEVNVEVKDNVLTVSCGTENKVKDEEMDFSSISYQSFSFSIPLSDTVDIKNISAKAEDGMLRIDLPAKALECKKDDVLKIEVK